MDFFDDDLELDDDDDYGFDDDDEDFALDDDEETDDGGGSPNRTFLIGAALLAGLFVISICVVIGILLTRPKGPSAAEAAIMTQNAIIQLQNLDATFTAAATITSGYETQIAPTHTPTPTSTATPTSTPTLKPTEAMPIPTRELSGSPTPTDTPEQTKDIVMETATPETTPTPEMPAPTQEVPGNGEMPDGGIADDLGLGNMLTLGLLAVGLLAVMFVSRRLRTGGTV